MSGRAASWITWSACGLTLAMIACAVTLAVPNRYGLGAVLFLLTEVSASLVGALIVSRRPENPVGWLVSTHALCFALGEFGRQYAIFGLLTEPGSLPLARIMASPPYWIWFPGLMSIVVFLPLYFPDGHLVSRRWRPVAWLAVLLTAYLTTFAVLRSGGDETRGIPNPLGLESLEVYKPLAASFEVLAPASWAVLGLLSAASLVVRFWRSRGVERQQIKWVVYAVVLFVSWAVVEQLLPVRVPLILDEVLLVVSLQSLWVAIGVAVLRYRLYDIDLLINRTLVYATHTTVLVFIYLVTVVLLQEAFRTVTGGESQLAVVASTLAIAALFSPLRRRIQGFIDRCFYRRKYDAAKTLAAFNARLRDETDLETLSGDVVGVVRETMQPEYVSLWLRSPEGLADEKKSENTGKALS